RGRARRRAALGRARGRRARGPRARPRREDPGVSGALDRFIEAAAAKGLHPDVRRFPQGTKTAEDAARAVGCDVAQIVKSLVFLAAGNAVVALVSGANRLDEGR